MNAPSAKTVPPLIAVVLLLASAGCASLPEGQGPDLTERRLLALESEFAAFVATPLHRAAGGVPLSPRETFDTVEVELSRLEALRLRYLDVVARAAAAEHQVQAMVRMAELHLDLGARIRRIPYPADAVDEPSMEGFDQQLSRLAVPLEAVGLGVLDQALDVSRRHEVEGRFPARAQLYLALHGEGAEMTRAHYEVLRDELSAQGPYVAPRRLLEAGRVGQRAARR